MLIRPADIGPDDVFDYCIVGSGPAGISCTLALIPSGARILLLEGGDSDISHESQSLYEGDTIGDPYYELDAARLRYFGGTSNHWNGRCRMLEEIDFVAKGTYAKTAWPIVKADLDPFLPAASAILEIPEIRPDRRFGQSGLRLVHFVSSPPVRFRGKYFDDLSTSANVFVALKANLLAFETNGSAVTGARIADFDGHGTIMRARRYVLATGGIENSRLLLWSNVLSNGALVKNAATLGRYWMEHPHYRLGEAVVLGSAGMDMARRRITFVAPTTETMRRERILGATLKCSAQKRDGTERILADLACVAPSWARRAMDLIGLGGGCAIRVRIATEQEPVAENRVELSHEKDVLGMPKATLRWRRNETDLRTARTTARLFAAFLAEADIGRMRLPDWALDDGVPDGPPPGKGGYHHMGGTRMASTPADGIVDRDCRVFGQENLYVAGSSVFPSGGYCNPTLSIVQLALRLGDHLRKTA